MKKLLAVLLFVCLIASSVCALAFESSLGYSIAFDEKWLEVSPLTLPDVPYAVLTPILESLIFAL